MARGPLLRLAAFGAIALAVRLAVVLTLPDADTDAYGHFAIARALAADPGNLAAHWVWLPAYHYALSALTGLGVGFTGVRVLSAILQAAAPFLLHGLVLRRDGDERAAELAALALTLAPLPNLMATSAQQETSFALLVLGAAWAIDRRRSVLAGALLATACLIRYEAWGAIAALAAHRLWRRLGGYGGREVAPRSRAWRGTAAQPEPPIGDDGPGLAAFAIPAIAVAAWILLRRRFDGEWLLFLRQTREFASGVRTTTGFSALVDALWFPVILPFAVLGPALLLVPVGLRRALRPSSALPIGILAFLLASYTGKGALGLPRYYTALVPFACVAIAEGAIALADRARRISPRAITAGALAALALTTCAHFARLTSRSLARAAELRGYEANVER